jgi:hypothetical protein
MRLGKGSQKDFVHIHKRHVTSTTVGEAAKDWSPKTEEKKPVQPEVSVDDKLTFWSYLTDVQFGKFDPTALTKMNTWIFTGDGKWLVQKNRAGYFGVKKSDEGIDTLPKGTIEDEAFVHLEHGKIPQTILDEIITFFRGIMKRHSGAEGFVQVYWDLEEAKYTVHVPKQVVNGAAVRYDKTKDLDKITPERYVFVYECHSHNNMGAFWSGTDNADENDLRLFGVYGLLGKPQWAHKHRCFVGEEEIDLSLDLIFDIDRTVEPRYEVTTDGGEVITVNQSDIAIDEAPRFMVQSDNEIFTVKKEAIKKVIRTVDIPETWYAEINTAEARAQVGSVWTPQTRKHNYTQNRGTNFVDSPYMPGGQAEDDEVEMSYSEEFEMETAVDQLAEMTNNFEDIGMCQNFCTILEDKELLSPLKNTLLAYLGEYEGSDLFVADDEQYEGYADHGNHSVDFHAAS